MSRQSPYIAIITDFGNDDWYVASMKAVIARIAPGTQTIDITHRIAPGDIGSASFVLSQCYNDFPKGTIFLCVVDPGVGSQRAPIILYNGDYYFVAPDNGMLSYIAKGMQRVYRIDPSLNPHIKQTSITFHGRDIFAPTAALLANRRPHQELGTPTNDFMCFPPSIQTVQTLPTEGLILYFDRFGNGITNLSLDFASPRWVELDKGESVPFCKTYSEVEIGKPLAYLGSNGLVEIAVNQGNARQALSLDRGMSFRIS